jgi:hypothetical protein
MEIIYIQYNKYHAQIFFAKLKSATDKYLLENCTVRTILGALSYNGQTIITQQLCKHMRKKGKNQAIIYSLIF